MLLANMMGSDTQNTPSPKTPPVNLCDAEKSRKYDRQLRLWGDHGQQRIESSKVCLVNANALGTEILKSLVLPGMGSFTIIDPIKVIQDDANNFFVLPDALGQSRAKVCTQMLMELNPDVRGDFIEESIEHLLDNNSKLFSNFCLLIACNLWNERIIERLSQLLWDQNIPLILCYSIGFIGMIRIQAREHWVVESHPDFILEDLRLDKPFPELVSYLEKYSDFDQMNAEQLLHTPYIVIIYKYLKQWQSENGKQSHELPSSKEKAQLRKLISNAAENLRQQKRTNGDGHSDLHLDNFDEAIKALNQMLVCSTDIPAEVQQILQDSKVDKIAANPACKLMNKEFWLLVAALKSYISQNNCLPLRGSIPDMTSDSARYIELQNIYVQKAKADREQIAQLLHDICGQNSNTADSILSSQLKTFCINSHHLRLIRTEPFYTEFELIKQQNSARKEHLRQVVNLNCLDGDCEANDLVYYLMLRSISRFYTKFNRMPGCNEMDIDLPLLKNEFKDLLNELGCNHLVKDDFAHEMCRYGGSELHSVSAFLAGAVAQEAIKLVSNQYTPLKNLLIYNAMTCVTTSFNW